MISLIGMAIRNSVIPVAPTGFWGPMPFAVMGGLVVATLPILFFLPARYVAWFKIEPAPVKTRTEMVGHDALAVA